MSRAEPNSVPTDPIADDLREFILRNIDSIAQLEALMLLRNDPSSRWDAAALARRLYVSSQESADLLQRLSADGLLEQVDGDFQYGCRTAELRSLVDRLALTYSAHLIPVTLLIHGKPRRIREFAEAFKLRKET